MIWRNVLPCCLALLSVTLAADPAPNWPQTPAQPQSAPDKNPSPGSQPQPAPNSPDTSYKPPSGSAGENTPRQPDPSESVFGAGCRWDPTTSNIEQVSFDFRTGQAPPSTWFTDVHDAATTTNPAKSIQRRDTAPSSPPIPPHQGGKPVLDASYHTRLIDVLTFRARYGSFGSSLNSAGCALPAFSERLANLEEQEREIINNYTAQHKPIAGRDNIPNAMFFWAGISNYNPKVRSDLIQTVVFYGDGCAANPRQGLCIYAAEYSNFRYSPEDHMCMGSNMPVFYPVDTAMTVVYRTQNGFRTQESWIDGKMVYSNIVIKFSEPEPDFAALGLCTGGATLKTQPKMMEGGKVWVIEEVRVPSGEHPTGSKGDARKDAGSLEGGSKADGGNQERQSGNGGAGTAGDKDSQKDFHTSQISNSGGDAKDGKNDRSGSAPGSISGGSGGSAAGNNGDKGVSGTPGSNGPSGGSDPHNDALPSPGGRAAHDAHIAHAAHMVHQASSANGGTPEPQAADAPPSAPPANEAAPPDSAKDANAPPSPPPAGQPNTPPAQTPAVSDPHNAPPPSAAVGAGTNNPTPNSNPQKNNPNSPINKPA
ncbi:uncharacterized protein UBRO_02933 [Ustilago bromivora]|uniref:Uncharacterized protein n=1 Tax=Ustilago bromivora TaxID=307758 RepID=A0A1K0GNH9_9BASI|nr:uncharacterized protein UBRO_02933 [Ustilago bromivora]SYW77893.1 uncharacterized protein UBRO2_02085 [Ustilago bromivora]